MRRCWLAAGLLAGLVVMAFGTAQSRSQAVPDAAQPSGDETAIRANVEAFSRAANLRDAKTVAVTFTPTAEFVDGDGNVFHGRAAIEAEFEALFKVHPNGRLAIAPTELRAIAPGVMLEEGTATVGPADQSSEVGYTIVHVKQANGKWLMASLRSDGDEDVAPHEQLRQLEWLIGDWVDESDDAVVRTSTRWSDDKNFILSDFVVQLPQRGTIRGTQRIGWDASIGKIRSWVFDAEGGHGEGVWTRVDDRWIVKATGVRPDGDVGTATNIYMPAGPDSFILSSVDRLVGDEAAPDITVKVVRRPPDPNKQAAR